MSMTQVVSGVMPRNQRIMRRPKHPFQVQAPPFCIQPFVIAPVLPGETLKSLNLQVRAVTDPIVNPLIGWWLEHYLFYVKLNDLYERTELTQMLLNPAWSPTNVTTAQGGIAGNRKDFYSGGSGMINYVELCRRVVVDHYFRDEDDVYGTYTLTDGTSTWSAAQVVGNSAMDSVMLTDEDTAVDVNLIDAATTDVLTAKEVDAGMRLWQQQQMYGLTELSYEDWLAQYGINSPAPESLHRPELLRYTRNWQYPSNTINPADGVPASAVSWTIQERADKPRLFKEPGFVFGVTVARPKTYVRQLEGTWTSVFNDFRTWLPPMLYDKRLSWKQLSEAVGPLASAVGDADGYMVDVKDLLLYGEHFTNHTLADTNRNFMDNLAGALTNKFYPIAIADVQELFKTPASAFWVRQDGIVDLQIASASANPLFDTSPRGGVRSDTVSGGGF